MGANLFSIPPGRPFLGTLAEALMDGRLVPGFRPADDPLALADATIYLPTRRAARALAGEFSTLLGDAGAILPAIRTIGEADEASLFAVGNALPSPLPQMGDLERRLKLARLARQWREITAKTDYELLIGEPAVLPASSADALWLAGDLCTLLDEFETEGKPLASILALPSEEHADWWRLTLTFLSIVTEHWPQALAASGKVSEAHARNVWLSEETARLKAGGPGGPVILAGSTATAPATIDLMAAICGLTNGAVVLPGYDRDLDARARGEILGGSVTAPGHAQHGLMTIVSRIAAADAADEGDAVTHIDASPNPRESFLADALRPSETTDDWKHGAASHPAQALDDLALIEAADEREEALAIACAMRHALADPAATCAVVTPDRNLARRVVSELQRFGIAANDSAGRPLGATAPGTLMATALAVALEPGDPIALVSLLKHPLTRLGLARGEARRAARAIEMIALRGSIGVADGARLATIYAARRAAIDAGEKVALPIRHLPEAERDLGARMAVAMEAALAPLSQLRATTADRFEGSAGSAEQEIGPHAIALTRVLEALCADETGDASNLYAEEAGHGLADFLRSLVEAPATGFAFPPSELADVIEALAAGVTIQPRGGLSARAFVWGTLEARLQHVDTAILAGLNEGSWPAGVRSGAFLSRLMRREVELYPPERRIGLAAHDFWMAMGAKRVVFSRSRRAGGAPTIASRWLQRITTLAGEAGSRRLQMAGEPYLRAARTLDHAQPVPRAERPRPRPPVESRPRGYSVTQVETLIRDPYAVYAAKILRLEPLPELMRDPQAAERGSLFHDVLGDFCKQGHDPMAPDALQTLTELAREKFAAEDLPAEIEAIWWPRMEALAENFLAWEEERDDRVAERHAEIDGTHDFAELSTTLRARADRIDVMRDGSIEIVDFKTGTQPSLSQARALLAPQLPLEGAMVKLGAFDQLGRQEGSREAVSISDLVYVRLRERTLYEDRLASEGSRGAEPVDPDALSEEALAKFRGLVAVYRKPDTAFVSRSRPFLAGDFSGPYDHLARAREWSVGDEESPGGSEGASR